MFCCYQVRLYIDSELLFESAYFPKIYWAEMIADTWVDTGQLAHPIHGWRDYTSNETAFWWLDDIPTSFEQSRVEIFKLHHREQIIKASESLVSNVGKRSAQIKVYHDEYKYDGEGIIRFQTGSDFRKKEIANYM